MASKPRTSTVLLITVILAFGAILAFFLWTGAVEGSNVEATQEVTSTATAIAGPTESGTEPSY